MIGSYRIFIVFTKLDVNVSLMLDTVFVLLESFLHEISVRNSTNSRYSIFNCFVSR